MTPPPPSTPFHAALAARRDYFNALFRREGRTVDPDAFMEHLSDVVAPLVNGSAGADAELSRELSTALFRLSLRAHRQGLLGDEGKSSALELALRRTLPALLPSFPERPSDLALAICNAALRLERLETARAERWLHTMETLGPSCADLDALFALGLVLAWREGAAEYAVSARTRFETLSPVVRRAALGVEVLPSDPARRFAPPVEDGPLGAPEVVARLGGFVGFQGVFRDPPLVVASEGRVFAFDSVCTSEVFADAFGATLRQVAEAPRTVQPTVDEAAVTLSDAGVLRVGATEATLPWLAHASSHAHVDGLTAVTLPHSHFVFVVGQRPAT